MEIWKSIPGFEERYEISSLGKIKRLPRRTYKKNGKPFRILKEKIIKTRMNSKGYETVMLFKNNKHFLKTVHRLVLLSFIGPNNLDCNHKNLIRNDNRLENLEYITTKNNFIHAAINGACKNNHGENAHCSKITNEDRIFIIDNKFKMRPCDLAKKFNVSADLIHYY